MTDTRVFLSDPGEAVLLADGSVFNILLLARQRTPIPLGEGVLGLLGTVVNDHGRPGRATELEGGVEDLRTRYGGFKSFVGDGVASGYEGNLYARAKGASAPRVVLMPVDLALKDKTITDATAVDLAVVFARGARTFTATAADEVFETSEHGLAVNDTIQVVSKSGATGVTVATTYYVKTVPDADTFTLSETLGGATLELSVDGSGTWRPISVAAGIDLAPRTIPAGTRLATASSAFVVRTLEDLTWAAGEFGAKSVRIAKVSGTVAAINTLAAIGTGVDADYTSIWRDTFADGELADSTLVVCTTATTVSDDVDAAELALRYSRAFEALLDSPAGQAVNVLACDRDESAIADLLSAHCLTARSRGYFRFGVVSPPLGTTASAARSDSGDGVARATLSREVVAYVHPGVRRPFLEDAANLSSADGYLVTVPAAIPFAARIANTPPWENPARPHPVLQQYGILELESVTGLVPATQYRAGVVVPEFTRQGGALVASFRDGILANKAKIATKRMEAYLALGILDMSGPYHKEPASPSNQELLEDACTGFLEKLKTEERVGEYAIARSFDAATDHLRMDFAVNTVGNLDTMTFGLLVSGDAVAQSA